MSERKFEQIRARFRFTLDHMPQEVLDVSAKLSRL